MYPRIITSSTASRRSFGLKFHFKCNRGKMRMTETPDKKQVPASLAVLYWIQMVYYLLLHRFYILVTKIFSFKLVAVKYNLSSVPHRTSDLCCVVSDCSLWPFLSHFDWLLLYVRWLIFSRTKQRAYNRSHICIRLLSHSLTAFPEVTALVFLCDNPELWAQPSPATASQEKCSILLYALASVSHPH